MMRSDADWWQLAIGERLDAAQSKPALMVARRLWTITSLHVDENGDHDWFVGHFDRVVKRYKSSCQGALLLTVSTLQMTIASPCVDVHTLGGKCQSDTAMRGARTVLRGMEWTSEKQGLRDGATNVEVVPMMIKHQNGHVVKTTTGSLQQVHSEA